jgi:hypothetical protein
MTPAGGPGASTSRSGDLEWNNSRVSAQRIFGRPWEEIPTPLRYFMLLAVVQTPIGMAHVLTGEHPALAPLSLVGLVLAALLLRGWRWLWVVFVFTSVLSFALPPYHWGDAWSIYGHASTVIALVLLLWPSTYRYFWGRSPRWSSRGSRQASSAQDSRP